MKKFFAIASVIVVFGFEISCTKHKGDFEENIPVASIKVLSPSPGTIINTNDIVNIKAQAISSATIHGYDVTITSPGDTTAYFRKHVHDHNDTLNISETWQNMLVAKNLVLSISLTLDHEGHTFSRKIEFRAN